jgi:general secretion pathway protein A
MYKEYYGLIDKPFNLTPDPDYLFMSRGHEEAYTHLEYAITEQKGFVVITGEIGSGKTTLVHYFLNRIPGDIEYGLINQTMVQPKEFVKMVCQEFDLSVDGLDKTGMLNRFHEFLIGKFGERKRVVLIVDEAQNLPAATLEELRMLSNLESAKHHLIQIILIGQPELKQKLRSRRLEQFTQRVTVYWHLTGLDRDEVEQYIRHRLHIAGAKENTIFNSEAIEAISRHSRGIPRLINILCDSALVHGYADDKKVIDGACIEEVVRYRNIDIAENGETPETPAQESPERSVPDLSPEVLLQMNKRMNLLEKRIDFLENSVHNVMGITRHLGAFFGSSEKRDQLLIDLVRMSKQSMEKRIDHVLESLTSAAAAPRENPEPQGRKAKALILPAAVLLAFLLGIAFYYLYPHLQ